MKRYLIAGVCLTLIVGCGNGSAGSSSSGTSSPKNNSSSSSGFGKNEISGANDFSVSYPNGTGRTIHVPLDAGLQNNSGILRQAIDSARPGDVLSLPAGTFKFYQSGNNTIQISGKQDLTIVGQGDGSGNGLTELVFHYGAQSKRPVFEILGSERVWLKNFAIDWAWEIDPLAYYAEVTGKGPNHINLRFPDPIAPEEVHWRNVEQINGPPNFGPTAGGLEVWGVNPTSVTQIWPRVLQVEGANGLQRFSVGDWVRIRQHDHGGNHVWEVDDSQHVIFDHVTIYSGTLMGWVLRDDTNSVELNYSRIVPKPGRPMSTMADGLHIGQFTGNLKVQNCEFSYQGDDALNIKQNVAVGVSRDTNRRLTLSSWVRWRTPFNVGDTIDIRRRDYTNVGVTPPISGIEGDTLIFNADVPIFSGTDYILINERYVGGNYIITDNYFHNNRARGILLKLPNGTVTGNVIENTMGPAVFFSFGLWNGVDGEGAYVDNLILKDNTFTSVNLYEWYNGGDIEYRLDQTVLPGASEAAFIEKVDISNNISN